MHNSHYYKCWLDLIVRFFIDIEELGHGSVILYYHDKANKIVSISMMY